MKLKIDLGVKLFKLLEKLFGLEGRAIRKIVLTVEVDSVTMLEVTEYAQTSEEQIRAATAMASAIAADQDVLGAVVTVFNEMKEKP